MFGKVEKWNEGSEWRKNWIEINKCSCLVGRKIRSEGKGKGKNACGAHFLKKKNPSNIGWKTIFNSFMCKITMLSIFLNSNNKIHR